MDGPDESAIDSEMFAAAGQGPTITSVTTDEGSTQVRQTSQVRLVITGKGLQGTQSVVVGTTAAAIEDVASREVTVSVSTPSGRLGPLDVTVVTKSGAATAAGALALTPWVLAPDAVGGRGTFESPMNLCDPLIVNSSPGPVEGSPGNGDTLRLLAGTHHCDRLIFLYTSVIIEGAGPTATFIQGTDAGAPGLIFLSGASNTSRVRDLSFEEPLSQWSIRAGSGELIVERVNDAGGIAWLGTLDSILRVDDYAYEGTGNGIDMTSGFTQIRRSTFRHCGPGTGIRIVGAQASIEEVTVQDCERGLATDLGGAADFVFVQVFNSELIDNRIGVEIASPASLLNMVIRDDDTTPQPAEVGVAIIDGDVELRGVHITGQEAVGISQITQRFGSRLPDSSLVADGVVIEGGPVGIDFDGFDDQTDIRLRRSTVRGQTVASVRVSGTGSESRVDLGSIGDPGMNALSVGSGFALDDVRQDASPLNRFIQAHGTTLNARSYDGQRVEGPASVPPDYRILTSTGAIQF